MKPIWPFPMIRNYKTDPKVDELFLQFASAPDLELVNVGPYYTTVCCSLGRMQFWSANAFYAWAIEGIFCSEGEGSSYSWPVKPRKYTLKGEELDPKRMPSRWAVRKMYRALLRLQKQQTNECNLN